MIKIHSVERVFKNLNVLVTALVVDIVLLQKNFNGAIPTNGCKVLIRYCSLSSCYRKNSTTISDNTIQAQGLGGFFKNLSKSSANVGEKLVENVLSNPTRALDYTAKVATAAANRSPRNVLPTFPEVINFYHTGTGFYLCKFV